MSRFLNRNSVHPDVNDPQLLSDVALFRLVDLWLAALPGHFHFNHARIEAGTPGPIYLAIGQQTEQTML